LGKNGKGWVKGCSPRRRLVSQLGFKLLHPNYLRMQSQVKLSKDDRHALGLNKAAWNALVRRKNCKFATPRGGQRIFCSLFVKNSHLITDARDNFNVESTDASRHGPTRSCAGLGRFLTYAVQKDVEGDEPLAMVSQEWIQDNGLTLANLFPDFQEFAGKDPIGTVWLDTARFIELDEVILECTDDATYAAAKRDGTFILEEGGLTRRRIKTSSKCLALVNAHLEAGLTRGDKITRRRRIVGRV